jgi:hypothetical protein
MKKYLFGFVGILLATAKVSACSFPVSTLEQQVKSAEEIFLATLLEAKLMPKDAGHEWPWVQGRFQIIKVLKGGEQPKEATLSTGLGRSDCGVGMLVSYKYVIFKDRKETGIASPSGTHIIEDFQEAGLAADIQSIVRRHEGKLKNK